MTRLRENTQGAERYFTLKQRRHARCNWKYSPEMKFRPGTGLRRAGGLFAPQPSFLDRPAQLHLQASGL